MPKSGRPLAYIRNPVPGALIEHRGIRGKKLYKYLFLDGACANRASTLPDIKLNQTWRAMISSWKIPNSDFAVFPMITLTPRIESLYNSRLAVAA